MEPDSIKFSYNRGMIRVVEKKVIKHLVNTDHGLLEIPIRVHFEYSLESQLFVSGSMERRYLFNRQAALDRLPGVDVEQFDGEIEDAVDKNLIEHLKFTRQAVGEVCLFERPERDEPDTRHADDPEQGQSDDPDEGTSDDPEQGPCDDPDNGQPPESPRIIIP